MTPELEAALDLLHTATVELRRTVREELGSSLLTNSPSPEACNLALRLGDLLRPLYSALGHSVRSHSPLEPGGADVPDPALSVVYGARFIAERRHPRADETLLVVDVGPRTLDWSRSNHYARHSAPVFWQIDPENAHIMVYETPVDGQYQDRYVLAGSDRIAAPAIGASWAAEFVLGLA